MAKRTDWDIATYHAGRPWMKVLASGAVAHFVNDMVRVMKLTAAKRADTTTLFVCPDEFETFEIPWKEALILSPAPFDADDLYTIHVEMIAKSDDSSQLRSISEFVATGMCGPTIAHSFKEAAKRADEVKWAGRNHVAETKTQRVKFSFERETDAIMFAAFIVSLSCDDHSFKVIDDA